VGAGDVGQLEAGAGGVRFSERLRVGPFPSPEAAQESVRKLHARPDVVQDGRHLMDNPPEFYRRDPMSPVWAVMKQQLAILHEIKSPHNAISVAVKAIEKFERTGDVTT
jgi:hypothetical protein